MRRSKEDVEDVKREVQIMHHLKGHDNIVTLIGAFEDRQSVHLVRMLLACMHAWGLGGSAQEEAAEGGQRASR